MGRFINADAYVSTGQGIVGTNMFVYCNNAPVNLIDISGYRPVNFLDDDKSIYFYGNAGNDGRKDITEKFDMLMKTNAAEFQAEINRIYAMPNAANGSGFALTLLYFYNKVTDGGKWDIKLTDEWSYTKTFIYNGELLTGEDLGNIHYGYVGSVAFPALLLEAAAGANQCTKGVVWDHFSTFFDEPQDNAMIKKGIKIYEQRSR